MGDDWRAEPKRKRVVRQTGDWRTGNKLSSAIAESGNILYMISVCNRMRHKSKYCKHLENRLHRDAMRSRALATENSIRSMGQGAVLLYDTLGVSFLCKRQKRGGDYLEGSVLAVML